MEQKELELLLVILTIIGVAIIFIIVTLFVVFQRRKTQLIIERNDTEHKLLKEIAETQIEIKEQTLRNISWELHDNIGQLLSLAKIQLNQIDAPKASKTDVNDTLSKSIRELRALSKISNPQYLRSIDLYEALNIEIDRFNRLNFIEASMAIEGTPVQLETNANVIVFRILQEFFSNSIKHSRATHLNVLLKYTPETLLIIAKDNGVGFDMKILEEHKGIGLINIEERAKLINAQTTISSTIDEGTQLTITIPL